MTKTEYLKADAEYIAEIQKRWNRVKGFYKSTGPIPAGLDETLFGARIRAYWASVDRGTDPEIARHRHHLADDFATVAEIPSMKEYLTASEWLES